MEVYSDINHFSFLCSCGDHEKARRFYTNNNPKISLWDASNIFVKACKNGHIKIAKFLYEISDYKIGDYGINTGFIKACKHGHLDIAMWIYIKFDVDIHANDDSVIHQAASNKQYKVLNWLTHICIEDYSSDRSSISTGTSPFEESPFDENDPFEETLVENNDMIKEKVFLTAIVLVIFFMLRYGIY